MEVDGLKFMLGRADCLILYIVSIVCLLYLHHFLLYLLVLLYRIPHNVIIF